MATPLHSGRPAPEICAKTFEILTQGAYAGDIIGLRPSPPIPEEQRHPFACKSGALRHPRETKGGEYLGAKGEGECC